MLCWKYTTFRGFFRNEIKDALLRDYSNCTHGLVVAVNYAEYNNSKTSVFSPNSRDYFMEIGLKQTKNGKINFLIQMMY